MATLDSLFVLDFPTTYGYGDATGKNGWSQEARRKVEETTEEPSKKRKKPRH